MVNDIFNVGLEDGTQANLLIIVCFLALGIIQISIAL